MQPNKKNSCITYKKNSLETNPNAGRINRKNLNKLETKAMEDLMNRDDIVITKANKGEAVVVNDVAQYIQEA